jgi:tetratricopeptide (TPR) repeat protein
MASFSLLIGDFYAKNYEFHLNLFKNPVEILKKLIVTDPNNPSYNYGLAYAYNKLANICKYFKRTMESLEIAEEGAMIFSKLVNIYPYQKEIVFGFTESYLLRGDLHLELGNFEMSLSFFEHYYRLLKLYHKLNPNENYFEFNFQTYYIRLGYHAEQTKNIQKAKMYYLECKKHCIEHIKAFPAYVAFQKNLQWVESRLRELG